MEIVVLISRVMLLVGLLVCVLIVMKLKRMNEKAKTFQEELRTFIEDLEVANELEGIEGREL
ncbi:hypothetical protein LCGC14_2100210 [marine sediment metagenome]|uniref:Uncharacterized protein n=1 Tax=marine sediment metagenome TaxID=412755 RepID=A0A0F9EA28_9ZZZZ